MRRRLALLLARLGRKCFHAVTILAPDVFVPIGMIGHVGTQLEDDDEPMTYDPEGERPWR